MTPDHTEPAAEQYRRRLYEAAEDGELSFDETRDRLLAIGRAYLGVENAHVERIDPTTGTHEVVASVGGDEGVPTVGATFDHATTYCRRTVEADSPVAISDAAAQGWGDDPAYEEHGLACYLGATISVDGAAFGTVCFVSREARGDRFSASERSFVELVASLLGRQREARAHRRQLEARERRLDERERTVERAEAALERSEAKHDSLLSTAPDAVVRVDAGTREVVEANAATATLVGRPTDELEGRDVLELHPPEFRDRYRSAFEALSGELDETLDRFPDGTPVRIRRADGTDVPVEISATTVELEGREFVQAVVRDVSDRKRREGLLSVLNRVLRHNLRNDMNVVEGFASLLADGADGDDAARATRIADTARELSALGEKARVLETAVAESAPPEPVDVAATVRSVAADLRAAAPEATVRAETPDELVGVARPRLPTAIRELGDNAIAHADGEPTVRLAATRTDGGVTVRVVDDGPGLPEPERRLLGAERETPLDHGSGIGLPLVYWIVTGGDGRVSVDVGGNAAGVDDAGTAVGVHLRAPDGDSAVDAGGNGAERSAGGVVDLEP